MPLASSLLFWRPALEASNRASRAPIGELFRIVCDGYPLRPLRTRAAGRIGAKCSLCSVHFSDSGIVARCRLESATPRPVSARTLIYEHGGRLGCRGCVRHSMAKSPSLIHLRNGAIGWRLHEDLTRSNTFRLEFVVRSWNEHPSIPYSENG
jgi:hypothetical protein